MQMTVDRDTLLKVLSHASGVPSRSEIPILTCLVIGSDGQGGFVRATDTDLEIRAPFAAQIVKPGSVAVPARLLADIVKRMPAGAQIGLSMVKEQLRLVCGRSKFDLAVLPAEDYPGFESVAGRGRTFEIEADRLRGLLAGVRHAICTDETRYYLGGIYLHVMEADGGIDLRAVATNGHMLALVTEDVPVQALGMPGVIVPKKTVSEILKLLPTGAEMVSLTVSERLIGLDLPSGWALASKLVDGKFPDYPRVIPSDNPHSAVVPANGLAMAIDRIATLCDSDHAGIVLSLKPDKPISIAVERSDLGSGRDQVDARVEGKAAAIGFNHRYFSAILASLAGADLELKYNSSKDPLVIRIEGSTAITHVLMPMYINAQADMETAAATLEEAA